MDPVQLGTTLRGARKAQRLTIAGASDLAGVSKATLKRWEAGRSFPKKSDLRALLDSYKIPENSTYRTAIEQGVRSESLAGFDNGSMVLRLLRSQRRKAGLTLAEVGAATGLSAPTLHRVETGQYAPDSDTLGAIAESVGLSKDETSSLQTAVHGGFVSVEDMASDVSTAFVQCLPDVRVRVFAHIEVLVRGRTGHDDLMESVRGLMMNGDRKALVEIWPLMRRAGAFSQVSNDERMVLQTLWTVARTGLSRRCPEPRELWNLGKRVEAMPPSVSKGSSMLYMARLAAIHKDWEDVLSWSECVELESGENPDLRLLAAINGHLVTAKWGSPSQALDGFGSVIARALNPVIKYTAEVYFAHVAISCGQVDRAREALERARHYEVRHKFGSPMADTQRAHLARA